LVNNYGITTIWTVAILPKTRKSDLEKIGKLQRIRGQQDYIQTQALKMLAMADVIDVRGQHK